MTERGGQRIARRLALAFLWAGGAAAAAMAEDAAVAPAVPTDWSLRVDAEQWTLPSSESIGVTRLGFRRQFTPGFSVGIDSLAAVRGSRGGFITLGVGGEYLWPLTPRWGVEVGASVTAGGGRGGYTVSGGGLLLRESLGLAVALDPHDRLSFGVARVDTPNGGVVQSTQAYVALSHAYRGLAPDGGTHAESFRLDAPYDAAPVALGVDAREYRVRSSGRTVAGAAQGNFGLVGASFRAGLGQTVYAQIEAGGAAHGASSGYMQILAGVGAEWPLTDRLSADLTGSVGAGGGGGVDTGGGTLIDARAGLAYRFDERDRVYASLDWLRAPSGQLNAEGVGIGYEHRFGPSAPRALTTDSPVALDENPLRVRVVDQEYRPASRQWATRPIDRIGNLGVQVDYLLGSHVFLTGQGLAAYSGRSGAYMIGLLGGGLRAPLAGGFGIEAEALVGAAGGGGVAVASGLVAQANAGVSYAFGPRLGVLASVGRLRSRSGGFEANVVGLSVTYRTTVLTAAW